MMRAGEIFLPTTPTFQLARSVSHLGPQKGVGTAMKAWSSRSALDAALVDLIAIPAAA
jgi:hypothetical protein